MIKSGAQRRPEADGVPGNMIIGARDNSTIVVEKDGFKRERCYIKYHLLNFEEDLIGIRNHSEIEVLKKKIWVADQQNPLNSLSLSLFLYGYEPPVLVLRVAILFFLFYVFHSWFCCVCVCVCVCVCLSVCL